MFRLKIIKEGDDMDRNKVDKVSIILLATIGGILLFSCLALIVADGINKIPAGIAEADRLSFFAKTACPDECNGIAYERDGKLFLCRRSDSELVLYSLGTVVKDAEGRFLWHGLPDKHIRRIGR